MQPSLTPRLHTIANLIPTGARLADVGTDHAYLPAYLLTANRIPAAIGTDIRSGPLSRARETVQQYGLEERLSLRLCDGLHGVAAEEVDAVVIAGMGGETILGILEAEPWSLQKVCILQPMSAVEVLRAGLDKLDIPIVKEILVQEGNTLYVVMFLDGSTAVREKHLTDAECYVGTTAAHANDPLWPEYLTSSWHRAERALDGLKRSKRPEDEERREYFRQVIDGLADMMKEVNVQ